MQTRFTLKFSITLLGLLMPLLASGADENEGQKKIQNIVIIFQENWSFDGLYGKFPGANGVDSPGISFAQVDKKGVTLAVLPQPLEDNRKPDQRIPAGMPVHPFDLAKFVAPDDRTGDLTHRFYTEQSQINGGKMDKFVALSNNGGLVMSHYDATQMPEGKLAQEFTLCDNFFHAAFGGSFLNHIWLIAAQSPVFPNAPEALVQPKPEWDEDGNPVAGKDNQITPDGFVVNTLQSTYAPHKKNTPEKNLMPPQTMPNIGDRLSDAKITWAWYAGGFDDALAGNPDSYFQFHHQPFVYFKSTGDSTEAKKIHLRDEMQFSKDLEKCELPAVTFIKPLGNNDEHPGITSLMRGQQHVAGLVQAIRSSPYWNKCAIVIVYDEHGGRWDHVAPPKIDRWGPGSRVPAIVVSPYAKKKFIDHTQYDTTSILKFIETRWNLQPLSTRDAAANNLSNVFDFSQKAE